MLYFDHAASSPPYPEVIQSVASVMERLYANPSSLHRMGQEAEQLLRRARSVVADTLGVEDREIIFTSGGTESNNLAIKGAAIQYRQRGNHIITTMIEHPSVYETCRQLEEFGFEVTYLFPDREGRVHPEQVKESLREDTILVSVMHVNNEIGSIQPIREIGHILAEHPKVLFHVDAVQSLGKLELDPRDCRVDLFSGSAHKFRGPRGAGLLYCRKGLKLAPLLTGGGQEAGLRSGTEAVALISGMAKAIRMAAEKREAETLHLRRLRSRLTAALRSIEGIVLTGPEDGAHMIPNIVHFCVPGLRTEILVHMLEEQEIYVSTQSACSSGENKPSRVLSAMGLPEDWTRSGVRISLSGEHTEADMDTLAEAVKASLAKLKRESKV